MRETNDFGKSLNVAKCTSDCTFQELKIMIETLGIQLSYYCLQITPVSIKDDKVRRYPVSWNRKD